MNKKSPSGAYILIIHNNQRFQQEIGKLGKITFDPGYFAYVGSAMNHQLLNRVIRHVKDPSVKKIHWHIDYHLSSQSTTITKVFLLPTNDREECQIAHEIELVVVKSVLQFGSSDCTCKSHLFLLPEDCIFL